MTNYVFDDLALDPGEPSDFPDGDYGDPPDAVSDVDLGEPPDFPDGFLSSEPPDWDAPPDSYAPPAYLIDVPEAVLSVGFEALEPSELDSLGLQDLIPGFLEPATLDLDDAADLDIPPNLDYSYDPADDSGFGAAELTAAYNPEATYSDAIWERYADAVMNGQNIGGNEADLITRAEAMNLVDARFLGYSDDTGYHVSALELAANPASGELYGQMLTVANFDNLEQATVLYHGLQGHIHNHSLPNYAVADLASHVALEQGLPLDWQPATEHDLSLYDHYQKVELVADEPPEQVIDTLIREYGGVDVSAYGEGTPGYEPESAQPLTYEIEMGSDADGQTTVEIVKEWDGGLRSGGGAEHRLISIHSDQGDAVALALDLVNLRDDVYNLTQDPVAAWQGMTSLAYEVGIAAGHVREGDPLFAQTGPNTPPDPFEVKPTEILFAEYQAMQREADLTLPEQETDLEAQAPQIELDL